MCCLGWSQLFFQGPSVSILASYLCPPLSHQRVPVSTHRAPPLLHPWSSRSHLLGVKTQVLPVPHRALLHLLLSLSALPSRPFPWLTLLQIHVPPHCSSHTPGAVLPQGLCTDCVLCLECRSPDPAWLCPSPPSSVSSDTTSSVSPL